jgi:hypothetical protein
MGKPWVDLQDKDALWKALAEGSRGPEEDDLTEAINHVIARLPDDHQFTDAAAAASVARDQSRWLRNRSAGRRA